MGLKLEELVAETEKIVEDVTSVVSTLEELRARLDGRPEEQAIIDGVVAKLKAADAAFDAAVNPPAPTDPPAGEASSDEAAA